ncbi:SECIS-binding protein 2, putative [Plasmodium relictum]|uniref:SECIS-binding protein 2, putative n=1 Tax=Plasmodium relictum TaxID=85471 RepID=A0A1J1H8R4_PLARL|nr:SECIS-binding protein 2, putative [Plasmodium relictum]CRG99832.1 SECIS-binding protein 2, putative [Plasmodium relictum]
MIKKSFDENIEKIKKKEYFKNEKSKSKDKNNTQISAYKDIVNNTYTKKSYKNEENNNIIRIGNRIVKIIFSSDKKKKKDLEKKKKMRILISKKKKKRKEFEKKKKMIDMLNKRLGIEKEKGNFYFLPKHLKKKKKSKLKKMIIIEKEIKNKIYFDILQKKENQNINKDVSYNLIKNKIEWKLKNNTHKFYYRKFKKIYTFTRKKKKNTSFISIYEIEDKNMHKNITEEINNLKNFILLNKKYIKKRKKLDKIKNYKKNVIMNNIKNEFFHNGMKCNNENNNLLKYEVDNTKIKKKNFIIGNEIDNNKASCNLVEHNINNIEKENVKITKNDTANFTNNEILNKKKMNIAIINDEISRNNKNMNEDMNEAIIKESIIKNEKILNYIQISKIEKKIYINDYVDHKITDELNNMVKEFLKKIAKSHEKLLLKKKRRYCLGLKECYKHICINEPKLIIVAPNIEPMVNNVFDDMIKKIIYKCKEKNIPLIYALSKNLLGKCINKSRQSIICIIDNDSYIKECNDIIALANFLKIYK